MPINFIHAADIHLGIENYGKIDPESGLSRRFCDFLETLNSLCETAISDEVDFVVLAGDIYKNPNPSSTVRRELTRILKKLHDHQIPVIIIVGNHDQANAFGKAHAFSVFSVLELPNLHVIDTPTLLELNTGNGKVQIIGIPWPQRLQYFEADEYHSFDSFGYTEELSRRVGEKIKELLARTEAGTPRLLFGHLMVKGAAFSGTEGMLSLGKEPVIDKSVLTDKRLAYVGLGHVHRFQELNRSGPSPIVYAGSLNRIDFQEKDDAKGFILAKIESDELSYRFCEVTDRPFYEIEIQLTDSEDPTKEFIEQLSEYDLERAVIKVSYSANAEIVSRLNWQKIHNQLKSCHYLVSIIPLRPLTSKVPRLQINEDFTVEKAFREYVKIRPTMADDDKKLTSLLKKLINEVEIR